MVRLGRATFGVPAAPGGGPPGLSSCQKGETKDQLQINKTRYLNVAIQSLLDSLYDAYKLQQEIECIIAGRELNSTEPRKFRAKLQIPLYTFIIWTRVFF